MLSLGNNSCTHLILEFAIDLSTFSEGIPITLVGFNGFCSGDPEKDHTEETESNRYLIFTMKTSY